MKSVILAAVLSLLCLTACSDGDNASTALVDKSSDAAPASANIGSSSSDSGDEIPPEPVKLENASAAETKLWDTEQVSVTAKSLSFGEDSVSLVISAENKTDKPVTVSVANAAVNGFMIPCSDYIDIPAKSSAEGKAVFKNSMIAASGANTVGSMELGFVLKDQAELTEIAASELVTLRTDKADSVKTAESFDGMEVVNSNGVKLVAGLVRGKEFSSVRVYAENNTDKTVTVTCSDITVIGVHPAAQFYCEILPGKRAVSELSFLKDELSSLGVTSFDEVKLSFNAADSNNETVAQSGIVTVNTFVGG